MAIAAPREFIPQNKEKYVGAYPIVCRSSWEWEFMAYCDNHPDVIQWASEPEQIPYSDPITGRQKVYIPDFLIVNVDSAGVIRRKLIEIKPMHEQLSEHARNSADAAIQARNRAKWGAAIAWCMRRGIEFEVMNESNIFAGYDNKKGRANPVAEYAPGLSKKQKPRKAAVPAYKKKAQEQAKRLKAIRSRVSKAKSSKSRKVAKARKA